MRLLIFSLDASFQFSRSPVLTLYLALIYIIITYNCYQNQLKVNYITYTHECLYKKNSASRIYDSTRIIWTSHGLNIKHFHPQYMLESWSILATNYCRDFSSSSREKVQNITGEIFSNFTGTNTSFIIMKSFSGFTYNKIICNDTYLD